MQDFVRRGITGREYGVNRFVGRQSEQDHLLALLRAGRGVLITGADGVGKSRLLFEIRDRFSAEVSTTVVLHCTTRTQSMPLSVFAQLALTNPEQATKLQNAPTSAGIRSQILANGTSAVFIDDAHLLDDASAGLVHDLAHTGIVIVAEAHYGAHIADAIRSLVKDDIVTPVELTGLSLAATAHFLRDTLGGTVDTATVSLLHQKTEGNPLFLTELTRASIDEGSLVQNDGTWRLAGVVSASRSISETLARLLAGLTDDSLRVLRYIAVADPLPLDVAQLLVEDSVLDTLEQRSLIMLAQLNGPVLRLRHPLYGDAVRDGLDPEALQTLSADLEHAFGSIHGDISTSRSERVTRAVLRLDAGLPIAPDELIAIAEYQFTVDEKLARRLISALSDDLDLGARLRLASLLAHHDDMEHAEGILDGLELSALDPEAHMAVILTRAFLLAMPGQRPQAALVELDGVPETLRGHPDVRALRSTACWRMGWCDEALTLSSSVFRDETASTVSRAQAGLTMLSATFHRGDHRTFSKWGDALDRLTRLALAELPEGASSFELITACLPSYILTDVRVARQVASIGYRAALSEGDSGLRRQYAHLLGRALSLQGDVVAGVDLMIEAGEIRGPWGSVTYPWLLSETTEAMLATGNIDDARRTAGLLRRTPAAPMYSADTAIAYASVMAADGDPAGAEQLLLHAAEEASAHGGFMYSLRALHAAMRTGSREAARRLTGMSVDLLHPGSAYTLVVAHAGGILKRDSAELLRVSRALADRSLALYAIDAAADTIRLSRINDDTVSLSGAWQLLISLTECHPSVHTDSLNRLAAELLTARERQIAVSAAARESDEAIGTRLGISDRTVQTHLSRVYAAMAINARRDLSKGLTALRIVAATASPTRADASIDHRFV